MERKPSPSNVSDEAWTLVVPYLTLMMEAAPQREQSWHEVFNGLRWLVRVGAMRRLMPHDLLPWHTVYQQSHRWLPAGVLAAIVQNLCAVLRLAQEHTAEPSVAIFNSRPLPSTPESGTRGRR